MPHLKKRHALIPFFAIALAAAGFAIAGSRTPANATRVAIAHDDLVLIDEALGEKKLVSDQDVKILFDQKGDAILYGKGWRQQVPGSEHGGGTELRFTTIDGSVDWSVAQDVREAFLDRRGKRIFSVNGDADLVVTDVATRKSEKMQSKVLRSNLSPDERTLVYQKLNPDWSPGEYYDAALGLTLLDLKTGKETRISTKWEDFNPFWTPNGKKIVFFSPSPEGNVAHFSMNPDGSERVQLTNSGAEYAAGTVVPNPSERPIWSADGKFMVYEADREIWAVEFAADYGRVVDARPIAYGKRPEWVKDGEVVSVLVGKNRESAERVIRADLKGNILK